MAQMTTTKKSSVWGDRIPSCTTNWKRRKRRFCNFKMSLKILNISQDKLNFLIALIILNICALIHLRDKIITIFICVSDIPSLQDALLDLKKQVSKLDMVNSMGRWLQWSSQDLSLQNVTAHMWWLCFWLCYLVHEWRGC